MQCEKVLQRAERGEVVIVTSALTLAEVLWLRNEPRLPKADAGQIREFFDLAYIRVEDVDKEIAEQAQGLVWDWDIRPKDAIHVATAIRARVTALETFDRNLIAKSGGIGAYRLMIREP